MAAGIADWTTVYESIRLTARTIRKEEGECKGFWKDFVTNNGRRNKVSKQETMVANTIRGLAMDGVQKANSGHPGMPMGMADVAAVLFLKHLNHCPSKPDWANRDRFVLSGGHGSMLLYSLLHLTGYGLPLDELKLFRQWGSQTPGHPEFGHTVGVETTSGPLGQGCGNAVGMALAERMLAARFNTGVHAPVDHMTYVFCGDGDMMEGISHEAFSLAGHLGLNKLVVFYDYNNITIEGATKLAYTDDVRKRFLGYKWNVLEIDGHDLCEIEKAIVAAKGEKERPTLIITRTHIAQGSPNLHDSHKAHGEPLGAEEIKATKRNLGLPENEDFHVPAAVREVFAVRARELEAKVAAWESDFRKYAAAQPELAGAWDVCMKQELPADLEKQMPVFDVSKPEATRVSSGKVMQKLAKALPWFVGGSADLAPSTKTFLDGYPSVGPGAFEGRNLHFGVREHGMAAVMNGMQLHGGFRVFGATFFVFSDYCRPSVRLAALMNLPVVYVFTHDSFYVGEDGPTHEPIEQIASYRCMPNVSIIRPGDPTETAAAWIAALKNKTGPTLLLLTRQNLPVIDRSVYPAASNVEKGAYTLWQSGQGMPDLILIGSGSETSLAMEAAKELARGGTNVRVVSMPSWDLFEKQSVEYKAQVLPVECKKRVAVEAGCSMGWQKYVGCKGRIVAIDHYGASAPYKVLAEKFGFTTANVVKVAKEVLG
jgi:transketolase